MVCPKCKYENLHGANFCEKCGLDLKAAAKAPMPPSPMTGYRFATPSYGSNHGSNSWEGGYTPTPRPTAAPRPTPAHRGTPHAGQAPLNQPPTYQPQSPPTSHTPQPIPPLARATPLAPPPPPRAATAPYQAPTPSEPPAFGRLVLTRDQTEFPLRYDDNLIGRASPGEGILPAVDLSMVDETGSVSRRHARIGKDDSSIYVEDLGSSNGTRHNGQPLRSGLQASLNDGDELVFGSLSMRFIKA